MLLNKALLCLSLAVGGALAAPTKRAAVTDADILQFALTLEHLENQFYYQGLAQFSAADFAAAGFGGSFYDDLTEIGKDEAAHVAFLTAGLTAAGATPVQPCVYSFPYTDAKSFVALSKLLEGTGVSAYLGAASLITNKDYLTAAGSILTVEARHNAFISYFLGDSPFPQPFDTPLGPNGVYTIAGAFIKSCPSTNAAIPVMAYPTLTIAAPASVCAGSVLTLTCTSDVSAAKFCAFASELSMYYSPFANGACAVPAEVTTGQNYVMLTTDQTITNIVAGPAILDVNEVA